ncbi:MAG: divergent PAP2 family protein [Pseudobutyrivibrio sp.]|nr:divergent PAP2 family protein [Pseudobutyrivibrio sp.]
MHFLVDLFTNKIFLAPAMAWLCAQVIKIVVDSVRSGFCKERFVVGGGMPSSHAATVTGLAIITAAIYGTGSFEFAIALFFGITVICDARGVRYETQRQGRALNNLNEERKEEGKQPLDIIKFKERIGHSIPELVVGMVIGLVSALIVYHLPF